MFPAFVVVFVLLNVFVFVFVLGFEEPDGNCFAGEGKVQCTECPAWMHSRSLARYTSLLVFEFVFEFVFVIVFVFVFGLARHIERKHSVPVDLQCDLCLKSFSSLINLKEHSRQAHGMSSRIKF